MKITEGYEAKKSIGIFNLCIFTFVVLAIVGMWLVDIAYDQRKMIKISEKVIAYNEWQCIEKSELGCVKVFDITPVASFQVERIRYGKDFMAVKISQAELTGWVVYGKGMEIFLR